MRKPDRHGCQPDTLGNGKKDVTYFLTDNKIPDELNASVNLILFPFLGMMASKDCPHMSFNSCFGLLILLLMRRVIHEHCH